MVSLESATELARRALLIAAELSFPILAVGLFVGLLFAVLQAITQVHEQTISFIPKLFAMAVVIFFLLPWFMTVITGYTSEVFSQLHKTGVVP